MNQKSALDNQRLRHGDTAYIAQLENDMKIVPNGYISNNLAWYYIYIAPKGDIQKKNEYLLKARSFLEEAIIYDENLLYLLVNLGDANLQLQQFNTAKEYFLKAYELDKRSLFVKNGISCCCFYLQQYTDAKNILKPIVMHCNKTTEFSLFNKQEIARVLYNYAIILLKRGEHASCKELVDNLYSLYCKDVIDIEILDLLDIVELYYLLKEYQKVIDIFPHEGYSIISKFFGIYISSLYMLKESTQWYLEKTLSVLKDDYQEYDNNPNIDFENKKVLLKEIQKTISEIELCYQQVMKGDVLEIVPELKSLSNDFVYCDSEFQAN